MSSEDLISISKLLIVARGPARAVAATLAEHGPRRLACPLDEDCPAIPVEKLESYNHDEIAVDLGRTIRNVEYALRNIRATWRGVLSERPAVESPE